jgi:hypothetical protein
MKAELALLWLVLGIIIPLQGFMLLVMSENCCAHTDPHPGMYLHAMYDPFLLFSIVMF